MDILDEKKFFFTIIMAVYNVGDYIDQAIISLENQSLSFKNNVELIIINDGSTDNSLNKAIAWKKKYPNNIIIISQDNQGVSSARNVGINRARGKYFNFLDPDDKLDTNVLFRLKKFFIRNPHIKIAHIPLMMFEARVGPHRLNKHFGKEVEIVNIENDYKKIFAHISSTFICNTIFADKDIRFEQGRKYGEDMQLIAKIVEQERQFCLINHYFYQYRIRYSKNSAMDKSKSDPETYLPNLIMINKLIQTYKKNEQIDLWLQTLIMYDLSWKLRRPDLPFAVEENFYKKFFSELKLTLDYIEESVIKEVEQLTYYQKKGLLSLKKTGNLLPISNEVIEDKIIFKIFSIQYNKRNDKLMIKGGLQNPYTNKKVIINLTSGDRRFTSHKLENEKAEKMLGISIFSEDVYSFDISLDDLKNIERLNFDIYLDEKNINYNSKIIFINRSLKFNNIIQSNYLIAKEKLIIFSLEEFKIELKENNYRQLIACERHLIFSILKMKNISKTRQKYIIELRNREIKKELLELDIRYDFSCLDSDIDRIISEIESSLQFRTKKLKRIIKKRFSKHYIFLMLIRKINSKLIKYF